MNYHCNTCDLPMYRNFVIEAISFEEDDHVVEFVAHECPCCKNYVTDVEQMKELRRKIEVIRNGKAKI